MRTDGTPAPGLRERKRRETSRRIAEIGLRMFLENGYEATTLDAIATAANISRRTFFHYFETKEAILRAWESRLEDAFREAFVRQPPGAAPLEALHGALASVISRLESDEAIAMDRLMHSTEALRARKQANYEQQEKVVFAAMIERWPAPERRAALRLDAMLGVGAFRIAAEAWSQSAGRVALADALDDAFRTMRAEIMAGAEPAFAGRANPS
jgi:AcrR family transcriptional regulator